MPPLDRRPNNVPTRASRDEATSKAHALESFGGERWSGERKIAREELTVSGGSVRWSSTAPVFSTPPTPGFIFH